MPNRKIAIPETKILQLYWNRHKSCIAIATKYHCSPTTIRNRIREFGIPKKSVSIARMKYRKSDFSNNLIEKAYIIGFRLGDLNVYQTNPRSELIVVRCNTTQKTQIALMKKLFSKYGHVQVSPGTYSTNINCYLNRTFGFLLDKTKRVPSWINQHKETALSFIAGYIDAEGNFILNQKRARFKIDSYDKEILEWITKWLRMHYIKAKFRRIAEKGQNRADGMQFKHNLWRINVNEATSLLHLIQYLKGFIQHQKRLRDVVVCEKNINSRLREGTVAYEPVEH